MEIQKYDQTVEEKIPRENRAQMNEKWTSRGRLLTILTLDFFLPFMSDLSQSGQSWQQPRRWHSDKRRTKDNFEFSIIYQLSLPVSLSFLLADSNDLKPCYDF